MEEILAINFLRYSSSIMEPWNYSLPSLNGYSNPSLYVHLPKGVLQALHAAYDNNYNATFADEIIGAYSFCPVISLIKDHWWGFDYRNKCVNVHIVKYFDTHTITSRIVLKMF